MVNLQADTQFLLYTFPNAFKEVHQTVVVPFMV